MDEPRLPFAFRAPPSLIERVDVYAQRHGWDRVQTRAKGVDTGRSAVILALLEGLVAGRLVLDPPSPPVCCAPPPPTSSSSESSMQLRLLQNGQPLPLHRHQGISYIEAPTSGVYELELINTIQARRMVVVSVDGRNVIDGTEASPIGAGYVLAPGERLVIPGFLKDGGNCARFTFVEAAESYTALMGSGTSNVGVIGVAVFDEKPVRRASVGILRGMGGMAGMGQPYGSSFQDYGGGQTKGMSHAFDSSFDAAVTRALNINTTPDVGTGYGETEAFVTSTTTFTRASNTPAMVLTMRYGTRARLQAWGVVFPVAAPAVPNPFPASPTYAPPPPEYPSR